MEITPGRAPFAEDEDYKPLRKPKSASTTPTHEHVYNTLSNSGSGAMGDFGNIEPQQQAMLSNFGQTVLPSNLSPFAKEFVPRFGGSNSVTSAQERLLQQQKQQQQYVQQNYHHYHQMRQQHHQPQQQQQHRVSHGYPNYQQGNQQMQPQQNNVYLPQVTSLCNSVQDRLRISGNNSSSGNQNSSNNYSQQQQYQHQNGRHNKHNAQQRYQHPSNSRSSQHNLSNTVGNGSENSSNDVESVALNYLHTVIRCLSEDPGEYDNTASHFLTLFDGMENNQYVLSNAMEDIFQESISNPNFRYMGAKLYKLLHMLNLKKDSMFHTLLKWKLDYHQTEVLQYMQTNQQHKVRETALFLAELYMQLRGDHSRIHLIAENIVFSLKQLLSKESDENVRCVCFTLKLAGYDLTSDCSKDIQEIMGQLDEINAKSPDKYPLVAHVISLQKNNWGRKVSSSLSDVELPISPEIRIVDEPVFYGPDGRELTTEEVDFLTSGAGALNNASEDDDIDPELDEETAEAYKEFCKLFQLKEHE